MQLKDYKGIWIFAEHSNGIVSSTTYELISKSKELSNKTDDEVTVVLLADEEKDMVKNILNHGADKVIVVESPNLKEYKTISYAKVLEELVNKYKPSIFLFGATSQGKDLAPRIMAKLQTGLTADCLDLDIDENGVLVQIKPSYGDNIMCNIICPNHRPQMATIRPKVFSPLEEKENPLGEIIYEDILVESENDFEILEVVPNEVDGVNIEEADIVVAAGRGVQRQEDMKIVEDLAKGIGGVLAVTRPLVDVEWYNSSIQIGASGKTIKPSLIMNIGISGAIQYNVGIQGSKCIVSINKNPKASIFDISHYGIVGDYKKIIPLLSEELKNISK